MTVACDLGHLGPVRLQLFSLPHHTAVSILCYRSSLCFVCLVVCFLFVRLFEYFISCAVASSQLMDVTCKGYSICWPRKTDVVDFLHSRFSVFVCVCVCFNIASLTVDIISSMVVVCREDYHSCSVVHCHRHKRVNSFTHILGSVCLRFVFFECVFCWQFPVCWVFVCFFSVCC